MSAVMPTELVAAFTHVPRKPWSPAEPEHAWQRRYQGEGGSHCVNKDNYGNTFDGARVFRDASVNLAQLDIQVGFGIGRIDVSLDFGPAALRELARRLVDAAHDIEINPAQEGQ